MNIEEDELCMLEQLCYIDEGMQQKAVGRKVTQKELTKKINKLKTKNCTIN